RLKLLDADSIFRFTRQIVLKAADEGNCVIVGRGSARFLQSRNDAFHVFLFAPYEDKVRRLVASGTAKDEAMRLVETVDADRADFIKKYFAQEWPNRELYHLMINNRAQDEAVVQTIRTAMQTLMPNAAEV